MKKLEAVEQARALFNEAKDWSVWRWLTQKPRVRRTADHATDSFDEYEKEVKKSWCDGLKKAYAELEVEAEAAGDGSAATRRRHDKASEAAKDVDPEIKAAARRVWQADKEAYDVRMDAERIFDEAEKRLSASMARDGSRRALESYDLREKAIRKAEVAARLK